MNWPGAIAVALALACLLGFLVLLLTAPRGAGDAAGGLVLELAGVLTLVLAVGLVERVTGRNGPRDPD